MKWLVVCPPLSAMALVKAPENANRFQYEAPTA